MAEPEPSTPEERAQKRAEEYSGLMWHAATYLIVNAFLWFIDIAGGGGVEWAYWVSIPWGIGFAFHAASYYIDARGGTQRRYQKFLAEERQRETEDS